MMELVVIACLSYAPEDCRTLREESTTFDQTSCLTESVASVYGWLARMRGDYLIKSIRCEAKSGQE